MQLILWMCVTPHDEFRQPQIVGFAEMLFSNHLNASRPFNGLGNDEVLLVILYTWSLCKWQIFAFIQVGVILGGETRNQLKDWVSFHLVKQT